MEVTSVIATTIQTIFFLALGWWRLAVLTEKVEQIEHRLNGGDNSIPGRCQVEREKVASISRKLDRLTAKAESENQ